MARRSRSAASRPNKAHSARQEVDLQQVYSFLWLTVFIISIFPVLSAALYFGSWFFCKSIDLTPAVPDVDHPSTPQLQHRLSPPQTPVPGFVFRQEKQTADQQADPEQEALAQAGPDSRSSSPVPGIARYSIDDDSVCLSFKTAGDESERRFLPQSESSI